MIFFKWLILNWLLSKLADSSLATIVLYMNKPWELSPCHQVPGAKIFNESYDADFLCLTFGFKIRTGYITGDGTLLFRNVIHEKVGMKWLGHSGFKVLPDGFKVTAWTGPKFFIFFFISISNSAYATIEVKKREDCSFIAPHISYSPISDPLCF